MSASPDFPFTAARATATTVVARRIFDDEILQRLLQDRHEDDCPSYDRHEFRPFHPATMTAVRAAR